MSRRYAAPLLALCFTVALPAPASTQTAEELRARLERLIELREQVLRASYAEGGRTELVRVGQLTGYAPTEDTAAARALLDSAWTILVSQLRGDVSVVPERRYRYEIDPAIRGDLPGLDVSSVAEVVRDVHMSLKRRLDPTGTYLDELPFEPIDRTRRTGIYIELVSAGSSAAHSCYLGDIDACRDALGLGEPGGDARSRPLNERARRLLVEVAIELGGEGAFDRLLAPAGDEVEARLAAAARVELDSVVSVWRARVVEGVAHRSPGVDPIAAAASLGWIAVFMFLASRRSRWRLD